MQAIIQIQIQIFLPLIEVCDLIIQYLNLAAQFRHLPIELINLARLVDERLAGCFLQIVYLFAGNIIVKQMDSGDQVSIPLVSLGDWAEIRHSDKLQQQRKGNYR